MASDAPVFIEDVPDIRLVGGMFHVSYKLGRDKAEFVLPPNVFLKALRLANRISDEFHEGGDVVPIRRRKDAKPTH